MEDGERLQRGRRTFTVGLAVGIAFMFAIGGLLAATTFLSGVTTTGELALTELASGQQASAGYVHLYAISGHLYSQDSAGVEYNLDAVYPHSTTHETGQIDEIDVTGLIGVLTTAQNADKIQGRDVVSTAPDNGDALVWNDGASQWEPGAVGGGPGAAAFIDLTDVPADYTDDGGLILAVTAAEDGVEFRALEDGDIPAGITRTTEIDTLGEMQTLWSENVTVDEEWDTQGEVETIWGTTLATDSELSAKPSLVAAGSNGTAAANAGDDTTAARSDHEHYEYRYLTFVFPGTIGTGDPGVWIRIEEAGAAGDIISAYAVLGTPGSTATTVDILTCSQANVDGVPSWTTIFTNKLLIDANERSTNTASTAPSLNVTSWTANDHFRLNIDAAGTSAANLTVTLKIRCKDKAS